ncbi:MAG: transcriptional regulator [Pseudonocardiales bacterium]|nr:MAG: transcriptional regulator [Pseudonocardiales bacterium]
MNVTPERTLDSHRHYAADCSVRRALEALGPHSALLLLREAFYGTRRFDDFVERVGISEQVAAARLKGLVHEGLLEREPYQDPGQRTRHAYRLTTKGKDLYVALVALMQWGDAYNAPPGGPSVLLTHRGCGAAVTAHVRCAEGHDLRPRDIAASPGPGAGG